jgi:hypothetical protein
MKTTTASLLIGIVFLAVGFLGFIDNPIVANSDTAIFHADTSHSIVHIISGVLFLIVGFAAPGFAPLFFKLFGFIYFFLGLIGLINIGTSGMGKLLGFLHVNGADNLLHLGLGIVIFFVGMALPKVRTSV